jgi:signal transduction histidine kinase
MSRVLVVEDDKDIAALIVHYLQKAGHTGLGLAIVKHLIELHGGKVSAANHAPHGAVFTIDLPAS